MSVSVRNSYSEDQITDTFLDNFHQGGKYSSQIASHQAEFRREEKFIDKKCLNISSLQTDYLNIDSSSSGSSRHNGRAHSVHAKCTFCEGNNHSAEKYFKRIRREKEKARAVDVSSNRNSECLPQKCFRCESEDHMIAKCPKPSNILRNGKSKYVLMKKLIVHATTAKITMTIRYTYLWHACLVMTNAKE